MCMDIIPYGYARFLRPEPVRHPSSTLSLFPFHSLDFLFYFFPLFVALTLPVLFLYHRIFPVNHFRFSCILLSYLGLLLD